MEYWDLRNSNMRFFRYNGGFKEIRAVFWFYFLPVSCNITILS